jgi:hypothetical protein
VWGFQFQLPALFGDLAINLSPRLHIATEIQGGAPKPIDIQRYRNLTLVLREPDPTVGKSGLTVYPKKSIKASTPYTKDNGKTWHVDEVDLLPMDTGGGNKPKSRQLGSP